MPCIPIKNGFLCGFHPQYKYKGLFFEVHPELGVSMLRKDGEPRSRQITEKEAFIINQFENEKNKKQFLVEAL